MLIKLGHWLCQIHNKLRLNKDKVFQPLIKILPSWLSPNQVTTFRFIVVLIWLPFALSKPSWGQIPIFLFIYFLDLVDGALARFKNQITYFGKHFDGFSDRFNHIAFWAVILGITNYKLIMPKFFIAWEAFIILFITMEYFLKNRKLDHIRTLLQFSVKIALWLLIIIEVV